MTAVLSPLTDAVADLIERLGSIPPDRILLHPFPGTATEEDLIAIAHGTGTRLYELIDGTLVRKTTGYYESVLATVLIQLLRNLLDQRRLGIVLAPDGLVRLAPGRVRLPDVCFISRERLPRPRPQKAVLEAAPDLAVEILSTGNTPAEMAFETAQYFAAGARLVWILDPPTRTVRVFTAPGEFRVLREADVLDGGDVLPGFSLPVREWFERAEAGF